MSSFRSETYLNCLSGKKVDFHQRRFLGKNESLYLLCHSSFFVPEIFWRLFLFTFTFASFIRLFHFASHSDCNSCINHMNSSVLCITMQELDNWQIDIKQFRTYAPLYIQYSVANPQPIFFLFGSPKASFGPLTRGLPLSLNVNHCVLSLFDTKVYGSLVTRLGY